MRLFRPCFLAEWLYPDAIFRIKTTDKLLCLTFDDGPDPVSTPKLLNILSKHNITALFFCNGESAEKYPDLVKQIKEGGHVVGNHGYSHIDGFMTSLKRYISDITIAALYTSSGLFRPPYGRLGPCQYRILRKTYRIVFWDIMPYDFDNRFGSKNSLQILKKKVRPGSIIVLHDNIQSNAPEFIDEFILFAKKEGYGFNNSFLHGSIQG